MKVIIKYKTELGRGVKYRAGSLQDLPDAEAIQLINSGSAIPYEGNGTAIDNRETRVIEPREVRAPVNNKRALKAAKIAREMEASKTAVEEEAPKEKVELEEIVEVESAKEEGSEDGVKKNNRAKRKSNKSG